MESLTRFAKRVHILDDCEDIHSAIDQQARAERDAYRSRGFAAEVLKDENGSYSVVTSLRD